MKLLRYNADDILSWAEFSGDFNPVHFDPAIAARLGLPQVPVHGMRVMLDVKSALYQLALAKPYAQRTPLLFKAKLRAPVLRDGSYRLNTDSRGDRHRFSLVEDTSGETCINGYLRAATPNEAADGDGTPPAATFTPEKADWSRETSRFAALSNDALPAWLMLDAMLFRSLFLHQDTLFSDIGRVFGFDDVNSASELLLRITVLQTHHVTLIPPIGQDCTLDGLMKDIDGNGLHYEIDRALTTGDASSGLAIEGSLVARAGKTLLARSSVGLLALPPHPSPQ